MDEAGSDFKYSLTMLRNKLQNSALHALLAELGYDRETKEELVYNFSNGRTSSSSQMEVNECQRLINHLKAIKNRFEPQPVQKAKPSKKSSENLMRRKILSICHEMNWKKNGAIDWERLNAFLFKSGYLHKGLNDYTKDELPKLVSQFEKLLKDFYAKR